MRLTLIPAIKKKGVVHPGKEGGDHNSIIKAKSLGTKAIDNERGFLTPQDKFLSREDALKWLEKNKPEEYKSLESKDYTELRSSDLNDVSELNPPKDTQPVDLSNKTVIVYDYGMYPEISTRFAEDFGKSQYYCHWEAAFPKSPLRLVGTGLEGVERIGDFWKYVEKADMIYFPDSLCGGLVDDLRKRGYPVVGAGVEEERFEQDRVFGRFDVQKNAGLLMQGTEVVKGVTALRKYLQEHKDLWIKINAIRGDRESFYHLDYDQTEPIIDKLAYDRGPMKEDIEFICEEAIKGIEPGLDGFIFEGETLSPCTYGYELKGGGFIGKNVPYSEVPEAIKSVNDGLAPFFKKNKTRMPFSTEVMVDKQKRSYLIDPTCREAGPCGFSIQIKLIENFSQMAYGLATGNIVQPIMKHKYCGGVSFNSEEANTNWMRLRFPKEVRNRIVLREAVKLGKDYYAVPGFDNVLTVIGLGDSVKSVVDELHEVTDTIQAQGLDKDLTGLYKIQDEIKEGIEYGIPF